MKVTVHAKGLKLLEEEKAYAEEKIKEILHKVHSADNKEGIQAKYEIDKEASHKEKTKQFLCTLTLNIPGKTLRSEAHCGGVYTSVDKVVKCMKSQLKKEKELHRHI